MPSSECDILAKAASPDVTRDEIRAMLQTLLADRFQLLTHRETRQVASYVLLIAKDGSKLKPSSPERKAAMTDSRDPSGKSQTAFEAQPLRVLVNILANTLGGPVVDRTELDDLYDFVVEWPDSGSSLVESIDRLGWKVESKKEQVEILVIDRAVKPAAN